MDTFADEVLKAIEEEIPDMHEGIGIPINAVFRAFIEMNERRPKEQDAKSVQK